MTDDPLTEQEFLELLAEAERYQDLTVICTARTHESKPVKVGVLRLAANGSVGLVVPHRIDRNGKAVIRSWQDGLPDDNPAMIGSRNANRDALSSEILITAGGEAVRTPTHEQISAPGSRWHYQLRCDHCTLNVSARKERIDLFVKRSLEIGVQELQLGVIAANLR